MSALDHGATGRPARIDTHAHYLGGSVQKLLDAAPLPGGFTLPPWEVDGTLDFMDRHDIAIQVLSVPLDLSDKMPPEALASLTRQVNTELAEVVAGHPDRFGGFAALPLADPDHALAELTYALDELGLDGVCLPSNSHGRYFGQPWVEPILAELARRATPTFVHPADPVGIEQLGFGRPSSVAEFPFDTARNMINAIYSGVFLRNPGLRLILPHAGGVLPTLAWRISIHLDNGRGPHDDPNVTREHIAQVLRDLYYDIAIAPGTPSLAPLLATTTPDHLLFGSDWPAAPEYAITAADDAFAEFEGMTDRQKDAVGSNARALFPRLQAGSV